MKRSMTTLGLTAILAVCAATAGQVWAGSDDHADIQQFLKSPQDLSMAIRAAEGATGGKAYAAEFETDKGAAGYKVKTLTGDKLAKVTIDASTGAVKQTKDKGLLSAKDDDDAVDPAQMTGSLLDLVGKAEQLSGGRVMSIDHESEDGATVIEVEIAQADGTTKDYTFDAAGNKIVPVGDTQG